MLRDWPRGDQEDLPRFVEYLESLIMEDEQIVRLEIINKFNGNYISIEPSGAGDDLHANSQYELVAFVRKHVPDDMTIEFGETNIIIWTNGDAAVFNNGVATLAYQYFTR